jgi:hypothetical protein
VQSGRYWLTFQRCILAPSSGNLNIPEDSHIYIQFSLLFGSECRFDPLKPDVHVNNI